jgi:SAM-dependent methyltransferase
VGQPSTLPKPPHLAPRYGAQFEDTSIAAAYHTRPPYPVEFFDILSELHTSGARRIVELGCGTGDATLALAAQAERVDAIEPSAAMLAVARGRGGAHDPRINWIQAPAESADFNGPYSLAVAAESVHWMEWNVVLPRLANALAEDAVLVLAERCGAAEMPWDALVGRLIAKYSTNREYQPYDLVEELTSRGLFREVGRRTTAAVDFAQSVDDRLESMHSRNGFSRDRMNPAAAAEFDEAFRQLLQRHCPDGIVRVPTVVNLVWGRPLVE